MKRTGVCLLGLWVFAAILTAQNAPSVRPVPPPRPSPRAAGGAVAPQSPEFFRKYCFECHGADRSEGGLSIDWLLRQPSVGPHATAWERVAEMVGTEMMPPDDASAFPTDAERTAAVKFVQTSLDAYERAHGGEPGRVTIRRLTSGEYGYAIKDLTGVDVPVAIDASSDAVGGEGFSNFGDVQFVEDSSIERYLEAAKVVADHAVIGAGPLEFYSDPGRTGLELSALSRINDLYASKGFRVVSGEGGRPFGLERYGKAFYAAWHYKHRAALGDPTATLRGLAAKEGITGRFADHVWSVVNRPTLGYPTAEMVERWRKIPAPSADAGASIAKARAGTDDLYKYLTTWPSWFFARGDLAAGGAGDESPLLFDDTTLKVETTRKFTYAIGPRGLRGRGPAPASGPTTVHLTFASLNPTAGVKPVVVWRNPRIVTRAAVAGARGAVPPGATVARGGPPVLATESLRSLLPAAVVEQLGFGKSLDATVVGPDDFVSTGPVSFTVNAAAANTTTELQVDVELGADKNAVVRIAISDRAEGSNRDAATRAVLGDATSAGYKAFRAGIAEYVSLLPPNSHGEANPADKDPVPPPFDNTYNSPEHDAFVLKVKYQRSDQFFTDNLVDGADRARLNHAWNDLFSSWPYHDAYLEMLIDHFKLSLKSRKIVDVDAQVLAALRAEVRPHVAALRRHYDEVMRMDRAAEPGHVEQALAFASRAWRRPLTVAEKANLRAFYQKSRTGGLDHDGALRAVIARVLVSPAFLYRVETVAADIERPLGGYELASRLSFFLWSSIPDDELRRAAGVGELATLAGLEKQVRRMTADPKARRVAAEFFGQWLGFYRFDQYTGVDTARFPEFSQAVRKAMHDEAVSTFEYVVRERRPVSEILQADYTFVNKPLAAFYGLDATLAPTDSVVKVEGARALNRGGALRLGSVLTLTSAPLRTSPVKRGDWVLRRILGTPTPPPPADAGSLPSDPKAFAGATLRQRLTEHKRNPACANCHLRIDPLGFPLEGFDAVGRVRASYDDGVPVDVTGEFADRSTIRGAEGLLGYLKAREPQFVRTLSRKMIGYALGRTVSASDRRLVDAMVKAGGQTTFTDLALAIVQSRQFRNRQGQESTAAGVPPVASRQVASRGASIQ